MRRLNPAIIALVVLLALIALILVYASTRDTDQDKLKDAQLTQDNAPDPGKRCASNATYDLIKRSLFQHAAQLRGSDQEAFDQIAGSANLRMENAVMESRDKDTGAINCSGSLSLDLPPGFVVQSGQRTLMSDVDYTIQPSSDGTGEAVILHNADAIITPLATLSRTAEPEAAPSGDADANAPDAEQPQPMFPDDEAQPPAELQPQPAPAQRPAGARPSFDCADARSRGEVAVCSDAGLAGLDRSMTAQYRRAMSLASPDEQALLRRTGERFIAYRDRCPTKACIGDAYQGRMQEIRDIMEGRWQSPR